MKRQRSSWSGSEQLGLSGNILRQYFLYLLGEGDTVAAEAIERSGKAGTGMTKALLLDMTLLWPYLQRPLLTSSASISSTTMNRLFPKSMVMSRPWKRLSWRRRHPEEATKVLLHHYAVYGRGKLAQFMAFRIGDDGSLIGIENFPHLEWDDLIGYAAQKEKLLANTTAFLADRAANNVLLTGSRGTGKSTAVKALVCRYHEQGLRLIQVQRGQLHNLQQLMERLGDIGSKKFILFLTISL